MIGDVTALERTVERKNARIEALEAALEISFDYMMDMIANDRLRYEGYKPAAHVAWANDEALVRAALAAKGE